MTLTNKKILIVDDSSEVREVLATHLESQGHKVFHANDGSEGLDILQKETKLDCIICDLQMPNISGIMFLKNIREQGIKTPLIFITGFDHILESLEAFKLGAQGFFHKPFKHAELDEKLEEIELFRNMVSRPEAEVKLDDYYSKVNVDEFVTGKKIIFPIFLRISDSKYIKIAHTGEDLDPKKIENLKKHGVEYFYLENDDFKNYLKRNIYIAKSLLNFKGIKDIQKREFFISITKNLMEYEFTRELNSEVLSMSVFTIHNTLKLISKKKNFLKALQDLNSVSPSLVDHSILVSLIASAIALESKKFDNKTVTMVSLAGLYHDYGLKELPARLAQADIHNFSDEERTLYQSHSQNGSQLLASIKGIPENVSQAILQHHELCDGSGFPFGIGRLKINPIARVLAIADFIAVNYSQAGKDADFKSIVLQLKNKDDIFDTDFIKASLSLVNSNEPLMKVLF